MNKYTITYKNGKKKVFRSRFNIFTDKVASLPMILFKDFPQVLNEKDWATSKEKIVNYISDYVKIEKGFVDGRKKETKCLDIFTWRSVFNNI